MTAEGNDIAEQFGRLEEQITDLGRVLARQATSLDRLVDADRARAAQAKAGADLPLLVDLLALYTDARTCAVSAAEEADRAAFEALADGLDRLITGRGGTLVVPVAGDGFDAAVMDAVDIRDAPGESARRTVADLVRPGLRVGQRSVRAAAVIVYR
ncbi:nucleotide exchange factor GrpE [Gordonia sp. DT30]|uniref:nucleotide exchange factor GrpE n=1 Tax=Gordonia sp. DT30 TaxID=3416546 RepID=UPI003CF0B6F0